MGAETPNQVTVAPGAVFLSCASQDADAARRICAALRGAGIEVWFDQSELRGGDAWDQSQMARSMCERKPDYWETRLCLALTFERLGQRRESDAQIKWLTGFYGGDQLAYQYAQFYAQRGDRVKALQWLETALRLHDAGLRRLKTDLLMDPLRKEPRFQAVRRELRFPN